MARRLRWRLPFKSIDNANCVIEIYKEGYTGSTVTELIGTGEPFEFDEDNDMDLLNFVRIKTGYLRVIEENYGDLNALAPSTITDHFVVAKYKGAAVFTGYMQCVEFENDWIAGPRVLEFPVISPLGLLNAFNFSIPQEPTLTSIGALLYEVLNRINPYVSGDATQPGYQQLVWPGDNLYPWNGLIHTLAVVPFNDSFQRWDNDRDLYSPRSFLYLIEGLCSCFGWTLHETPARLIFASLDWAGQYSEMNIPNLINPSNKWSWSPQLYISKLYYEYVNNDPRYSVMRPLKSLTIALEGNGISNKTLGLTHTKTIGSSFNYSSNRGYRAYQLQQIAPDVQADNLGIANFSSDGNITNFGTFPISEGFFTSSDKSASLSESWIVHLASYTSARTCLLKARFYGLLTMSLNGYILLKLKMQYGTALNNMGNREISLFLTVKIGTEYLNVSSGSWSTTEIYNSITIDGNTGSVRPNSALDESFFLFDVDGIILHPSSGWPQKIVSNIEIGIYTTPTTANTVLANSYLQITQLALTDPQSPIYQYIGDNYHRTEIKIKGNTTGTDEGNITANINNYSNCVCGHSIMTANGSIAGTNPTYSYMFAPQQFLTVRQKQRQPMPGTFDDYVEKFILLGDSTSGAVWKILARGFNLARDEYKTTYVRTNNL